MNLTTLARAKQYLLGSTTVAGPDAAYRQLIAAASGAACQFTGRTFQRTAYTALRLNGTGNDQIMMPSNPIISVSSLQVDGATYQPTSDAAPYSGGYQFDSKFLYLFGAVFCRGTRNVIVSLITGYTTEQTAYIPSTTPFTITPVTGSGVNPDGTPGDTTGPASVDLGVENASTGAALVAVAPGANLTAGHYSFDDGVYSFAAADAGVQVTMSYDYVPSSAEQAVIDTIGNWFNRRANIGINSKNLASETLTYADVALTKTAKALLQPYRFVVSP